MRRVVQCLASLAMLFLVSTMAAQSVRVPSQLGESESSGAKESPAQAAPALVQFGGALHDRTGQVVSGVAGLTFALYKDQQGGAALWMETQNVEADSQG